MKTVLSRWLIYGLIATLLPYQTALALEEPAQTPETKNISEPHDQAENQPEEPVSDKENFVTKSELVAAKAVETSEEPKTTPLMTPKLGNPLNFVKGLQGNFDTDLFTGSAAFSYPLELPTGRKNLQPQLALNYSSLNRRFDSYVGYGWSIPTASIFRSSPKGVDKLYQDSRFTSDLFGNVSDLVLVADGVYQAERKKNLYS